MNRLELVPPPRRRRRPHWIEDIHYGPRSAPASSMTCACGWQAEAPSAEALADRWTDHRGPVPVHH